MFIKALKAIGSGVADFEDWTMYWNASEKERKKADADYDIYLREKRIADEIAAKQRHSIKRKKPRRAAKAIVHTEVKQALPVLGVL